MKLPIHTDFTRHSTIQAPREGSKVMRGTEPVVWVQSHRALISDTSTSGSDYGGGVGSGPRVYLLDEHSTCGYINGRPIMLAVVDHTIGDSFFAFRAPAQHAIEISNFRRNLRSSLSPMPQTLSCSQVR